jgi:hypothetical protein
MSETINDMLKKLVSEPEQERYVLTKETRDILDDITFNLKKMLDEQNRFVLDAERETLLNWQISEVLGRGAELMIERDRGFWLKIDGKDKKIRIGLNEPETKSSIASRKNMITAPLSIFNNVGDGLTNCGLCKVFSKCNAQSDKLSYLAVEMVMDLWLRFGADEFAIHAVDTADDVYFFMFWNNTTSEQIDAYWADNYYLGWSPYGLFWKREWVRKEQRGKISSSGKIGDKK